VRTMAENYKVKDGDFLTKIAVAHGFRDYRTIWSDAKNKTLKDKRKSPNILMPDDDLFIPDKKTDKEESGQTDHIHVFRVIAPPLMLRLRLQDLDDEAVVGTPYHLEIDGQVFQDKTKKGGLIEHEIPPTAQRGVLTIGDLVIPIHVGFLHPIDEISGWRARLNNLGYNAGESDDPDDAQLRSAVEEFQCDYGLDVDGVCGPATQKKLKERHGC
jgi:hypothetical protein